MSVRRLVGSLGTATVAVSLVAVSLVTTRSFAADLVTDVYVATLANGGSDGNDCSQSSPCATVARAVEAAETSGTTIHIGAGSFDGEIEPGSKSVSIDGVSSDDTRLTTPQGTGDGYVVGVTSGTTSLSHLTIEGGLFVDVFVFGTGSVDIDHVALAQAGCGLVVTSGEADLTDSTVQDGGQGCISGPEPSDFAAAEIVVTGGSASLVRTQVLNPEERDPGVAVSGGTFTADRSTFDDSHDLDSNDSDGIQVTGGTATVTRSVFHGLGSSGVFTDGGTALLTDDTFSGNVVGVTGSSGSTTVVRSTLQGELASLQGTVSVAGSVLGTDSIMNCAGAVSDLGYNLATDDTCGFTTPTSLENVAALNLDTGLSDRGGPVPTVAIRWPSSAVDTIPAGATYGDPAMPLCTAGGTTDLRGVPRPVGGACDAGSMEMAATTTTVTGPAEARPHRATTFHAEVGVPAVIGGPELPAGSVTFMSGARTLCPPVVLQSNGDASCTTSELGAGKHAVSATYTPAHGSTLHASVSPAVRVDVGTTPAIRGPRRVVLRVGTKTSITFRTSGKPAPVMRLTKGRLPRGLRFHRGTRRATITGTPKRSAVGRYHLRVRSTTLVGSDAHGLTLVVKRR